jgi:hypothetical protein
VFTPCAGFVEIDDAALLLALYADPAGRELWAAAPLAEGLLVRAGVSEAKLQQLLIRHGARLSAAD